MINRSPGPVLVDEAGLAQEVPSPTSCWGVLSRRTDGNFAADPGRRVATPWFLHSVECLGPWGARSKESRRQPP
jgi:hypothetical protein